jgi:hypothetical protein
MAGADAARADAYAAKLADSSTGTRMAVLTPAPGERGL